MNPPSLRRGSIVRVTLPTGDWFTGVVQRVAPSAAMPTVSYPGSVWLVQVAPCHRGAHLSGCWVWHPAERCRQIRF